MRDYLLIVGLVVLAMALRACRPAPLRKAGAFLLLAASFYLFHVLTGHWAGGLLGVALWFFLPWLDLVLRVRKKRLPRNNRLSTADTPSVSLFPHAGSAIAAMEMEDFDHVDDGAWVWSGMEQYHRIFWNPEEHAFGTVCLCEQDSIAFAFVSITSVDRSGVAWRTTNFPFSPRLAVPNTVRWNHVPCEQSCFRQILKAHRSYLERKGLGHEQLAITDPDDIVTWLENEMSAIVAHNLKAGIIEEADEDSYRYSLKGLFFLWKQLVRDMIRLC